MFNAKRLYMERLSNHIKELSRYLRYIFTGHLVIAMFFIVSAMAFYYQRWLEELPLSFPAGWVISIILGLVAIYSPIQTLLKRADLVFLLPTEHKLMPYFYRSFIYSYVTQLYLFVLVSAALAPLFFAAYGSSSSQNFFILILILAIIKVLSLLANWWMHKIRDKRIRAIDLGVRYIAVVIFIYFMLEQAVLFSMVVLFLIAGLFSYNYYLSEKKKAINWDILIVQDHKRMRAFYRLANMFTDVPHLEKQIKKRHLLVRLLTKGFSLKKDNIYAYLYRITTIRSTEYLGIYLRLILIGGILIYYVPNHWLKLIFACLFLYMMLIQMVPLWKHHQLLVWTDIYPISTSLRQASFIKWMQQLILVPWVIFSLLLLILGSISMAGLFVIIAGAGIFVILPNYLRRKIVV
ncbi:ABC transporter permease [Saliterribacillus persicus]|uniref:ABC-2 type transport system permease protein n=1 Tax=Saliterribacillus persicus TaxID=930114 RepID=A0A368XR86_9BACI|nr:ABC transporter permease [Saliterribacillus persicus]RCW69666.1 ABC-2 type transport system permease protein [Saliterribacillus persicus]